MNRYKNLEIWQRSLALATEVYKVTSSYPKEEKFALVSQIRRSVISVSSNIAEGAGRNTNAQYLFFINTAYGSLCELESQIILSQNLNYIKDEGADTILDEIEQLQKMIYTFSKRLKP